jgi:UDP-GlcNAc:undecaprenyl-phosphate GlcNAc-1-phosphate transferase
MMAGLLACLVLLPVANGFSLLAFALVWAVGLVDDIYGLSSVIRLGIHLFAGALLWTGGWQLQFVNSSVLSLLSTCFLVAFVINAINLFDGMDGLAAGTAAVMAVGFLILSSGTVAFSSQVVAWSLLGICLGMLVHNFPPARIFMGDSGSTLIGVLLAFLILDWARIQPNNSIVPPMILVSLPLADALLAAVRRLRSGRSPFSGDRRHFYDLLLERGWSVGSVLSFSWGWTAALGAIAWLSRGEESRSSQTAIAVLVVTISFSVAAHVLGSLRPETNSNTLTRSLKPHADIRSTKFQPRGL